MIILVLGVINSARYFLRPSTYGLDSGDGTSREKVTIIMLVAVITLVTALASVSHNSSRLTGEYTSISSHLREASRNITLIIDTFEERARELHRTIGSLNESIADAYSDIVVSEPIYLSEAYLRAAYPSCPALPDLSPYTHFYQGTIERMAAISHRLHLYHNLLLLGPRSWSHQAMKEFTYYLDRINKELESFAEFVKEGAIRLEEEVQRAQSLLPNLHLDALRIRQALQRDLDQAGKALPSSFCI